MSRIYMLIVANKEAKRKNDFTKMSEKNIRFAFVILHYKALEETEKCVESILAMSGQASIGIVIIDNCSPDGSGKVLQEKYGQQEQIKLILNTQNAGFSHANNQGCALARACWDPDFYIVANNDIQFPQQDFVALVEELYEQQQFYIAGPDIYNTRLSIHQSPMGQNAPTLQRAWKTVFLNGLFLSLFPITYPYMKHWFAKYESRHCDTEGYDIAQENVLLQGACVIFAKAYVEAREAVFYPETYFFSEEAIYTKWCEKHEKKTYYSPRLQVLHNESAATLSETDRKKRIRFQMQNIYDATKLYVKLLRQDSL